MHVKDIRISHLLILIKAIYLVAQHTVLPRGGKSKVMTNVDQMVMFCLLTRRKINLVRLILDFIISSIHAERRRHFTLPYGMPLTRIVTRAQLPSRGHRSDDKRPTTTIDTFTDFRLKPRALKMETKKKKKKDKKKKYSYVQKDDT